MEPEDELEPASPDQYLIQCAQSELRDAYGREDVDAVVATYSDNLMGHVRWSCQL